jgi:hypothetical protein
MSDPNSFLPGWLRDFVNRAGALFPESEPSSPLEQVASQPQFGLTD